MAAITKADLADVKPLEGVIIRRVTLGATTTAPAPVTLQSDGKWDPTLGQVYGQLCPTVYR